MGSPKTINTRLLALLAAVLLTAAAPSFAQEPPAAAPAAAAAARPLGSLVEPLTEQQKLLGPFGNQWGSLPPERQQALAHGSERWLAMSPEQRDQARERFSHLAVPAARAAACTARPLAALPGVAAERAGGSCGRTFTASSSCRRRSARCCASNGATRPPSSASR